MLLNMWGKVIYMSEIKKKVCLLKDDMGECLKWQIVGDKYVPIFREEDKECNRKHFDTWKEIVKNKKIRIMPEDD